MQQQTLIYEAIQKVAVGPDRGRDLERGQCAQIAENILAQECNPIQVAVLLIALRMKRESMQEFLGLLDGIQSRMLTFIADVPELWVLADPYDGYVRHLPMSPFLPAVLSACGLPTLICGVKSCGPKHGITAHQVYQASGIAVDNSTRQSCSDLQRVGWAYLDQQQFHPELYAMQALRDTMIKRTALTTIERVLMPIRAQSATHMVLGYVHKAYPEIYAALAQAAGYNTTLLIKGLEGGLTPALNKPLRTYFVDHNDSNEAVEKQVNDYAFSQVEGVSGVASQSQSDDLQNCVSLGNAALAGEQGVAKESLVLAAAQILAASRKADSMRSAVEKVRGCLDNGSAQQQYQRMIDNNYE